MQRPWSISSVSDAAIQIAVIARSIREGCCAMTEALELLIRQRDPVGGAGPETALPRTRDEHEPGVFLGRWVVALEGAHRPRAALVEDVPLRASRIPERTLVDHVAVYARRTACANSRLIVVDECSSPRVQCTSRAGLVINLH